MNQDEIKLKIKYELGYDSDLERLDNMLEMQREQEIDLRRKRREILLTMNEFVKRRTKINFQIIYNHEKHKKTKLVRLK